MFFFKKPKIVVDCFTSIPHVYELSQLKKSSEFIPDWWKKTPISIPDPNQHPTRTIRGCTGIVDTYRVGFMLPIWSDLSITVTKDTYSWQFSDFKSSADSHPISQWQSFADQFKYFHLKLHSPWMLKTKEDILWANIAPIWNTKLHNNYITPSGVIGFKYQHSTNVNMMLPYGDRNFQIKLGEPLVHFIPLTEKEVILKHHLVSEEELQKYTTTEVTFINTYLKRKSIVMDNEKSKCPFHWGKK